MPRRKSDTPNFRRSGRAIATSTPKPNVNRSRNSPKLSAVSRDSDKRGTPTKAKSQSRQPSSTRKPYRYRPGALALKEIRRYQKTTTLLIPKLPFSRLIRECLEKLSLHHEMRIQRLALEALQEAAEIYLVQLLEDAYLCSAHAGRVTLQKKDLHLVRRIRGRSDILN